MKDSFPRGLADALSTDPRRAYLRCYHIANGWAHATNGFAVHSTRWAGPDYRIKSVVDTIEDAYKAEHDTEVLLSIETLGELKRVYQQVTQAWAIEWLPEKGEFTTWWEGRRECNERDEQRRPKPEPTSMRYELAPVNLGLFYRAWLFCGENSRVLTMSSERERRKTPFVLCSADGERKALVMPRLAASPVKTKRRRGKKR